jgi:hypothetical protein
MNRDKGPSPLSSSKVEEWFMITFVVANSLLDLFNLLFRFRFGTDLSWS